MNSATCIICLVPYSEELEIVSLRCHHCFHRTCIKEWFKIRTDCPQCRKFSNPRQMYRVLLSFETSDPMVPDVDTNNIVVESQAILLSDLEQQLLTKNLLIQEKDDEIKKLNDVSKNLETIHKTSLANKEKVINNLTHELKNKDKMIAQTTKDVREIENMLTTLEMVFQHQMTCKEDEIEKLQGALKLKESEIERLKNKAKDVSCSCDTRLYPSIDKLKNI